MSGLSDLAGAADQLAQAVVSGNHKCVKNLLRSDVALHRAGLPTTEVVRGVDRVTEELQALFTMRGDRSELLSAASSTKKSASFLLLHHKDQGSVTAGKEPRGEAISIWCAMWSHAGDGRPLVSELICLFNAKPAGKDAEGTGKKFEFDVNGFKRAANPSADAAQLVDVTTAFINLYDEPEGAADKVPSLLAEDFVQWEPLKDATKEGRKQIQDNLEMHAMYWQTVYAWCMVVPVDETSAFSFWVNAGHMRKPGAHPGEAIEEAQGTSTYYGIEFVTINDGGMVQTTLHMATTVPKADAEVFDFIKAEQGAAGATPSAAQ